MNFFGKKDLIYLLVIAILLLSVVFFACRGEISESKYDSYRKTVLNRALEGSIQLLGEYIETEDAHLSAFLASRLGELALGDEEREAVTAFCCDVSRSDFDSEAKERAKAYAASLMSALIENRSEIKTGNMASFPLYEGEISVSSQPVENPYLSVAKRLLNASDPRSYRRGSVVGYRTASAYAEFENGILVRYLCRRDGNAEISADEAKRDAEKFASLYCGGGKILSESRENGVFTYNYDGFYVVVSPYGGVMRYARTKI